MGKFKYRDPNTGKVFNDIEMARQHFCTVPACVNCPLASWNNNTRNELTRKMFCSEYPAEAAQRMGYQVIDDKDKNMDKLDKPLSDWTLGELKEYCFGRDCMCQGGCAFWHGTCHFRGLSPSSWNLKGPSPRPRLTSTETAIMRAVGAEWVSKDKSGVSTASLWSARPQMDPTGVYGLLDAYDPTAKDGPLAVVDGQLFPSVIPGDCVRLQEDKK